MGRVILFGVAVSIDYHLRHRFAALHTEPSAVRLWEKLPSSKGTLGPLSCREGGLAPALRCETPVLERNCEPLFT
jgi:hypothetical protein